jgi:preprotein translocase subunit SecF
MWRPEARPPACVFEVAVIFIFKPFHRLKNYLDAVEIDFVSKRYIAGTLSVIMVLTAWALFAFMQPNWGIDFTGGTEIVVQFEEPVDIAEVRAALVAPPLNLSNDSVQQMGSSAKMEFAIRIQDPEFGMKELVGEVRESLLAKFGEAWFAQEIRVSAEVGARFTVDYIGEEVPLDEIEAALEGISGVKAQSGKELNQVVITVPGLAGKIKDRIEDAMGDRVFEVQSIDAVGPKVGVVLAQQGFTSIVATLGLVLLYVAFRFDVGFAPGAILALIHDVSIVVGIFVFARLEFNLPMIGALLTIVGYSLNDTIVIYDRIRENKDRYNRKDLKGLINVSINETLTRTVATSVTTLLAMAMFILIGGPVIQNFALAMFLGIIFGTYSTVFVASPMILVMEDVKPHLNRLMATTDADVEEEIVDDGDEASALSESEKRRRARADADAPTNPAK